VCYSGHVAISSELLSSVPAEVVNELAILEDRAERAEGQLKAALARGIWLEQELQISRSVVEQLTALGEAVAKHSREAEKHYGSVAGQVDEALRIAIKLAAMPRSPQH
jgi:hypothetical protein